MKLPNLIMRRLIGCAILLVGVMLGGCYSSDKYSDEANYLASLPGEKLMSIYLSLGDTAGDDRIPDGETNGTAVGINGSIPGGLMNELHRMWYFSSWAGKIFQDGYLLNLISPMVGNVMPNFRVSLFYAKVYRVDEGAVDGKPAIAIDYWTDSMRSLPFTFFYDEIRHYHKNTYFGPTYFRMRGGVPDSVKGETPFLWFILDAENYKPLEG